MDALNNLATSVPELHELARDYEATRGWPSTYPSSPMLDESFVLNAGQRAVLRTFKLAWLAANRSPNANNLKLSAMQACANALLGVDLAPAIEYEGDFTGGSDCSTYSAASHVVTLRGRLSIVTFLHELTHSQGFGEHGAVWWSVNTFRLVWPKAFAKLRNVPGTHVMRAAVR